MSALQKDIIRQNYPHLNDELVIDEEFLNLFVPSRVLTDENINKILVRIFNEVKSWSHIELRNSGPLANSQFIISHSIGAFTSPFFCATEPFSGHIICSTAQKCYCKTAIWKSIPVSCDWKWFRSKLCKQNLCLKVGASLENVKVTNVKVIYCKEIRLLRWNHVARKNMVFWEDNLQHDWNSLALIELS